MPNYEELADVQIGKVFYENEDLSVYIDANKKEKKLRISVFNNSHFCDEYVFDMEY